MFVAHKKKSRFLLEKQVALAYDFFYSLFFPVTHFRDFPLPIIQKTDKKKNNTTSSYRFAITLFARRCSHKCGRTKFEEVFFGSEAAGRLVGPRASSYRCISLYTASVFIIIFFKVRRPVRTTHT